jgi:hypothetical protein
MGSSSAPDYAIGRCAECGFDWTLRDYETLVGRCVREVADFGEVMSRVEPSQAVQPGLWSASRYVWHTVDVLRFGTERLWTISADPSYGVPVWDENVMAEVRSYDELSPVVGLVALIEAAHAWRQAALEAPQDAQTPHPEVGAISAYDVVQRNAHEVCHHLWDVQRGAPARPA